MGQQHDFYLVQSGNLVPRAALWRGFLACFQQPSLLRPANLDSSDRIYNTKDFDHTLVLDGRTKLVARKVTEFLQESGDRFQKAILFCVDQEHAARMRQALINENADLVGRNHRYVMRITGDDSEGQAQLGNFIDPESRYPVLVTTSRLLSTGVDAQTCRLITSSVISRSDSLIRHAYPGCPS